MTAKKLLLPLVAALALAACAKNPDDGAGTIPMNMPGEGGAFDQNSVAYFNTSIGDRVLFLVDQSTLTPAAIGTLDAQANWLLGNPQYQITVEGHADEQGTREYNLALGARRASAVKNYLLSRGVTENRMTTISYGKERPIQICSDEACWAQNRRAVTVVTSGF